MKIESPRSANYAATVVYLKDFVDLPNCDFVKHAMIFGNAVIVGKDAQAGDIGLFFPVETQLSLEFLTNNNLLRKNAQSSVVSNVDPEKSGFFEANGRVKAVKFRGHKSEGFFMPASSLNYLREKVPGLWLQSVLALEDCTTFDKIGDHEICRKYVVPVKAGRLNTQRGRLPKLEDQIVDGQFRFHFDTENLRRNLFKVQPNDYISVSDKWHGTSVVISKVLTKRKLNLFERLLNRLGASIQDSSYGLIYSSRRVIKAVNGELKNTARNFYTSDVWGAAAKEVEDKIPPGFTLYGEIVGFTPDGKEIQSGYHYGCPPSAQRLLVYRVTVTGFDGDVIDLPWKTMRSWLKLRGIDTVPELFYGKAKEIVPYTEGQDIRSWQEDFLKELEALYVHDQPCPHNGNKVPAEGIVVRIDHVSQCEAYKLKNFGFLERESTALDKGALDMETAEAELEQAA